MRTTRSIVFRDITAPAPAATISSGRSLGSSQTPATSRLCSSVPGLQMMLPPSSLCYTDARNLRRATNMGQAGQKVANDYGFVRGAPMCRHFKPGRLGLLLISAENDRK